MSTDDLLIVNVKIIYVLYKGFKIWLESISNIWISFSIEFQLDFFNILLSWCIMRGWDQFSSDEGSGSSGESPSVFDQFVFSLWNSDRFYVTTQLCVVAMASISDTLLQRLHDLGGTVTSESFTHTHTRTHAHTHTRTHTRVGLCVTVREERQKTVFSICCLCEQLHVEWFHFFFVCI